MGEKTKNTIMNILKSDEIRAYFEEMLQGQTDKIVSSLQTLEDTRLNEEIQELKKRLTEEQEKSRGLALENQEIEKVYKDKTSEVKSYSEEAG